MINPLQSDCNHVTTAYHTADPLLPLPIQLFLRLIVDAVDDANQDQWKLLTKNWEYLKNKEVELPAVINLVFEASTTVGMEAFYLLCEKNRVALKEGCRGILLTLTSG